MEAALAQALDELDAIRQIEHDARESLRKGRSEAAWNSFVHYPLLKLAIQNRPNIALELVTSARIMPKFAPKWFGAEGDPTASKMVDFVLLLSLDPEEASPVIQLSASTGGNSIPTTTSQPILHAGEASRLHAAIVSKISSQPAGENALNQTRYSPLTYSPIAISLETKSSAGSIEEAKVQLGVWTAAWHKRMKLLLGLNSRMIVTLPLLLAVEHDWKLFFACDKGDSIRYGY
ncbi:hypothetical protein DL769_006855 [Monosporascus sp. CRB-8-3]|nr:hypothetical protein DL769_006855 [Monosporascus sp. CRB-8-3]